MFHSQIPFYFDKSTYEKMVFYSEEINRISLNVLKNIKEGHSELLNYFDDFMFKEKIFNLKCQCLRCFGPDMILLETLMGYLFCRI